MHGLQPLSDGGRGGGGTWPTLPLLLCPLATGWAGTGEAAEASLGSPAGSQSQSRLLVRQSKSAREAEVLLLCHFEFEIIFTV